MGEHMNPIVTVLLTTAAGALVGTMIGVLLMRRQLRPPINEAEHAELKNKLLQSESSLAAATTKIDGLEKQVVQRDQTLQEAAVEFKQKQQQLDLALKEAQAETVRCSAAEHRVQELGTQADLLTEQ